ncbi:MAG: rRNA maturation RNase YbeY [Zetaproteobacteria bacterium]|nr:rRNA maturation RNase YbeY [Zetaproteobacteria bacterium]
MIDVLCDEDVTQVVADAEIQHLLWAMSRELLEDEREPELCIRFASDAVVAALNLDWRQKANVTDVLSFPMQDDHFTLDEPLGDIVLAAPFVACEAQRLGVDHAAHVQHLIIHGMLHLLGFDHIDDNEALLMQAHERHWMAYLQLHNPYPDEDNHVD